MPEIDEIPGEVPDLNDDVTPDEPQDTIEPELPETEDPLTLFDELFKDLDEELSLTDAGYNADILKLKIRNAIREVKTSRKYPESYSDERIDKDLYRFYGNIRDISLYDYNAVGRDFEQSHSEAGVSVSLTDRNKLFSGIYPLSSL